MIASKGALVVLLWSRRNSSCFNNAPYEREDYSQRGGK